MDAAEITEMPEVETRLGIASALEAYNRAVKSEIDLEVDFDADAIQQIQTGTQRLGQCVQHRLTRELYALAAGKGAELPTPREGPDTGVEPDISLVVKELEQCNDDPLKSCIGSRQFRYQVVSLFILGRLESVKAELVRGIRALRRFAHRGKGRPHFRKEYVHNVEMRLVHVEAIYQEVFSVAFDVDCPELESFVDETGYVEKSLNNIETDVSEVKSRLETIVSRESDCVAHVEELCDELKARQTGLVQVVKKAEHAQQSVRPVLDSLSDALRELDATLKGSSAVGNSHSK